MHPGMRPAFLSHHQPYQLPYHDHNVQHLHDQLLIQGMIQFGPFDPLYQQHHFPVEEEPPHPLICMTSDVKPRLRWTPELHGRFVDAVDHLGGPFICSFNSFSSRLRGYTKGYHECDADERTHSLPVEESLTGIRKRANSATTPPVGPGSSSVPSDINEYVRSRKSSQTKLNALTHCFSFSIAKVSHLSIPFLFVLASSFQPLQVPRHSSIESFDNYMASLGYIPTLCSDGFAELGKGGGEGLRDSDEDPSLAYLNLDVGEMSTHRNGVTGDDSGWVAGEFPLEG
ncbi:hypothetical protein RHMOL_Rhmol04G0050600 [Rhododendron molle]|uniref:Uncharacterized protein n=1 Tax=Rhododendron molle TaxID=49168 RepID=A0ACC0NX76_RHOML|nr:hypothetical protein RHMOL_Rhmol04G0050600 [Rhododendron molle]